MALSCSPPVLFSGFAAYQPKIDRSRLTGLSSRDDRRASRSGLDLLGECPLWSIAEQALYWVDIRNFALRHFEPDTGRQGNWTFEDFVVGAALGHEALIVAMRHDLVAFDPRSGARRHLLQVEDPALENRLNEARVDPAGRLLIGSMRDFGAAVTGSLYSIEPGRAARRLLSDIRMPNGMAWSPDERTFYFADSGEREIRAFGYDITTGDLGASRVPLPDGVAPGFRTARRWTPRARSGTRGRPAARWSESCRTEPSTR